MSLPAAPRPLTAAHFRGGRSPHYAASSLRRSAGRPRRAPRWSPAAAQLALSCLDHFPVLIDGLAVGRDTKLFHILTAPDVLERFISFLHARGSRCSATLAASIFSFHSPSLRAAVAEVGLMAASVRCMHVRQLLESRGAVPRLHAFELPPATTLSPITFHALSLIHI